VNYELEGEILREHVDDLHSLFDATVDKLRDINLAAGYGGLINETLEYPETGKNVWPKLSMIMALSTLLGLCLGGGISVLYEVQNGKLRTAQEIERLAAQSVMGQVPSLSCLSNSKYLKLVRESGSNIDRSICTVHDSLSQESEVFRGLRTVLFFKLAELKTKTFAVTSANAGDGKSTISGNIAVSIAQSGRKVLLIECDLRKPSVAGLFASVNVPGLSEVLARAARIEDAIHGCEVDNLDILSAGEMRDNPAELLASHEFKILIDKVEAHYDFVILDCPPVLAVADPCIISSVAGAMVVVAKLNQFSRVELRRTMEMLDEVQASVVGIVVNNSVLEVEGLPGKQNRHMIGYGYGPAGSKAAGYYRSVTANGSHATTNGSSVTKRL
jgi:polysaccharide biosynthesis transport protein